MSWTFELAMLGLIPDRLARLAVRRLLLRRLEHAAREVRDSAEQRLRVVLDLPSVPPLWQPGELCAWRADEPLGNRSLDAASHWPRWAENTRGAEKEMLELIQQRSGVAEEQSVLVVARRHTAVIEHLLDALGLLSSVWTENDDAANEIRRRLAGRGIQRSVVHTGDLDQALAGRTFDRILVIESLPTNGDPREFLAGLGRRLRGGGRLFLQLACHRRYAYRLSLAESRWLGQEAGALIAATDLPPRFSPQLALRGHWELSGEHYERTLRAWRKRLEDRGPELLTAIARVEGRSKARRVLARQRLHLLAREEMFGLRGGQEWWISHYLLERSQS